MLIIFAGLAGSASYIVFMTDYDNYAGVFTCQKLAFAHRQSASILSRTPSLDKIYVDQVRELRVKQSIMFMAVVVSTLFLRTLSAKAFPEITQRIERTIGTGKSKLGRFGRID
jgi:hypothetical protein